MLWIWLTVYSGFFRSLEHQKLQCSPQKECVFIFVTLGVGVEKNWRNDASLPGPCPGVLGVLQANNLRIPVWPARKYQNIQDSVFLECMRRWRGNDTNCCNSWHVPACSDDHVSMYLYASCQQPIHTKGANGWRMVVWEGIGLCCSVYNYSGRWQKASRPWRCRLWLDILSLLRRQYPIRISPLTSESVHSRRLQPSKEELWDSTGGELCQSSVDNEHAVLIAARLMDRTRIQSPLATVLYTCVYINLLQPDAMNSSLLDSITRDLLEKRDLLKREYFGGNI